MNAAHDGLEDAVYAAAHRMKAALEVIEIKATATAEQFRRYGDQERAATFERRAYFAGAARWFLVGLFGENNAGAPRPASPGAPASAEGLHTPPEFRGDGTAPNGSDTENG